MFETIRYYFITKSMSYLMMIPDITLDMAYEISDNHYDETFKKIQKIIVNELLAG